MPSRAARPNKAQLFYEVICHVGLERFVQRELRRRCAQEHQLSRERTPGEVLFSYSGDLKALRSLETADDIFRVLPFNISRPRGILEPLALREITSQIVKVKANASAAPLKTFRLSAAGAESRDLVRIREILAKSTGLKEDRDDGDLLIRLRRSKIIEGGWDVLIRLTRRPLHVRSWRSADYRGALSAPIARVMVELLEARPSDTFLDPMCGSGTILIEQLRYRPVSQIVGVEQSAKVLELTKTNLKNIKYGAKVTLINANGLALPLEERSVDCIAVNPPWGEAIKEQQGLSLLYQQLISESLRVLRPRGKICLIVQDKKTLEDILSQEKRSIEMLEQHSVLQRKGFHPTIYLLQKK